MGPAEPPVFEGHHHIIFDFLAARGAIEPAQLQAAFDEHKTSGQDFPAILFRQGLLDKAGLLCAVAEHLGCDFADKLPEILPAETIRLIESELARQYGIVPIAAERNTITLLAVDPFNPHLVTDISFATGREIRLAIADPDEVRRLVRHYYGEYAVQSDETATATPDSVAVDEAELSEADIEKMAGQTPVIRFVNLVLAQAIRDRASDIHFEPFAKEFKIRYRIDGTLCEMAPPDRGLALPVVSRLKVLANLNIAERRLPQDGRISLNFSGRTVDLRVSTLPTQFGESVVLRVLDQSAGQLELEQIGLPGKIHAGVQEVIGRPNGIFIVTGPTGSGKTTTLYSCLKRLNSNDAKLLTVEDPVEYEIEGVMQVPVNPAAGLTFARALRTFLRQDPDIVMVGEIRDFETAQIAIQASLTGHLVLTTLHTNDAAGAVTRLVDMGIEPFLLASTLEGVLAQRLVRRVCQSCKTSFIPDHNLLKQLGADFSPTSDQQFHLGAGCESCHHTGYRGRLGIFEFLRLTDSLRELIMQGVSMVELRQHAMREGMTTLRDAGLQAIHAGETTVEEVLKYT